MSDIASESTNANENASPVLHEPGHINIILTIKSVYQNSCGMTRIQVQNAYRALMSLAREKRI